MSKQQRRRVLGDAVQSVLATLFASRARRGDRAISGQPARIESLEVRQLLSVPAAPSSLSGTTTYMGYDVINLSWVDNSNNETGFKVDRSTDPAFTNDFVSTTLSTQNQITYSVTSGLVMGATYYFRVRAYNADGDSANTLSPGIRAYVAGGVPVDPSSLVATPNSSSQITLTWQNGTGGPPATTNRIDRSTSADFTANLVRTDISGSAASYPVTGLSSSTPYYFRLTAINSSGWSNQIQASATTQSGGNQAPTVYTAAAASPATVTATTTSLSVLGADDGGEANLTYTWSVTSKPSGAADPTYSVNGTNAAKNTTATFSKAGAYTFRATITDTGSLNVTSSVNVTVNQTLTSISVSPSNASISDNTTQQFTASALDQFGAAMSSQPSFTWSIDSGGQGSVNGGGLYTAPASGSGSATVRATSSSVSGSAGISYQPANQAPTVATPAAASPSTVTAASTSLSVLGADDGGESNLTYTWATTGTPPAAVTFSTNVSNAAKNSTATFAKAGSYSFQVTIKDAQNATVTSNVTVTVNQTLTSIAVSPSTANVQDGATQQFTATANDQFGVALTAQPSFTWSLDTGSVGSINSAGLYAAPTSGTGTATVRATSGAISSTAAVTVTQLTAPTAPSNLSAAAVYSGGPQNNLSWTDNSSDEVGFVIDQASDPTFANDLLTTAVGANVTSLAETGLTPGETYFYRVRAYKGTYPASALYSAYSNTATVRAVPAGPVPGDPSNLTATAPSAHEIDLNWTNAGGPPATTNQIDYATSADFTANFVRVRIGGTATVCPATGLLPNTTYYFRVTAINGGGWSNPVAVSKPTPDGNQAPTVATVAAASPATVTGTTTSLSVLGADDAGEANLTYTWSVTSWPTGATVPAYSTNGTHSASSTTATLYMAGTYTFMATITDAGNLSATSSVNVTVTQTLSSIVVSAPDHMDGSSIQFSAAGLDQFGKPLGVQPAFTWSLEQGSGNVDPATGIYRPSTDETGDITVRARSSGVSSDGTFTILCNGAPAIDEGGTYTLHLLQDPSRVSEWSIDWGDGQVQTIQGGPSAVTHPYADGTHVYRISATALAYTGFGVHGVASTTLTPVDGGMDLVVVQPGGGIVSGGNVDIGNGRWVPCLVRYTSDGALDTTFGTNGIVIFDLGDSSYSSYLTNLAVQQDGKLIAVGETGSTCTGWVARFTTDGRLDTSFGTTGVVTAQMVFGRAFCPNNVDVQGNGGIIIGSQPTLFRMTAAGVFDPNFGVGGWTDATGCQGVVGYTGGGACNQLALDAHDNIIFTQWVTAGQDHVPSVVLARFTASGQIDASFADGAGKVLLNSIGNWGSWDLAIQSDGSIIVAGMTNGIGGAGPYDSVVLRVTTTGHLDTGFGTGGVTTISNPGTWSRIAIQSNDQILVSSDTGLLRFSKDGAPDPGFGTAGRARANSVSFWNGMPLVQADGKILCTGVLGSYPDERPAVVRWFSNGQLDVGNRTDTISIVVNDVAPTATFTNNGPVNENTPVTVSFSNATDISPADIAAGFRYSFATSVGALAGTYAAAGTVSSGQFTFGDNGTYTVYGRIFDKDNGYRDYTTTVVVNNVAPTATFSNSGPVNEGSSATVSFSGQSDVPADVAGGFHYSFATSSAALAANYAAAGTASSALFSFDDNGSYTVYGRIFDKDNGYSDYTTVVVVNDVAPTASFTNNGPVNEGSPVTVSFTSPSDISAADSAAGFRYSFATTLAGLATTYASAQTGTSAPFTFADSGSYTVYGRIFDKDNGYRDYTTTVVVNDVAPTATFTNNGPVNENTPVTVSFSNATDISPADIAAGFHYSFATGVGALAGTYAAAGTTSSAQITFGDNGTYTVYGRIFDKDNGYRDYTTTVVVNNVAPTATFSNSGPVREGSPATVSFSGQSDSPADLAAGLHYSFADSPAGLTTSYAAAGTAISASYTYDDSGSYTVYGRIFDKDNAYSDYTTLIRVVALPVLPDGLAASDDLADKVTLTWNVAPNADSYEVRRSLQDDCNANGYVTFTATGNTYDDATAVPGVQYFYFVRALNLLGDLSAFTAAEPGMIGRADQLTGSPRSATQVSVSWVDNTSNETGFLLEYSTQANFSSVTGSVSLIANMTQWSSNGFSPATRYYFRVRATNAAPNGYSNTMSLRTFDGLGVTMSDQGPVDERTPVSITATVNSTDGVTIQWAVTRNGLPIEVGGTAVPFVGATTTQSVFTFTPPSDGSYEAIATAVDRVGTAGWGRCPFDARNVDAPVLTIEGPTTVDEGHDVSLTARAIEPAGSDDQIIYTWQVLLDGKTVATGAGRTLLFHAADSGEFTVKLTGVDPAGRAGQTSTFVEAQNVAPTVTIDGPAASVQGDAALFVANATDSAGEADTLSYSWSVWQYLRNGAGKKVRDSQTGQWQTSQVTLASGVVTNQRQFLFPALPASQDYIVQVSVGDGDGGNTIATRDFATVPSNGSGVRSIVAAAENGWWYGHESIQQPDGKILLVGEFITWETKLDAYGHAVPNVACFYGGVIRMMPDGTRDASFGANGAVLISNAGPVGDPHLVSDAEFSNACVLPDGKIVVVGSADRGHDGPRFLVQVLNADGSPDGGPTDSTPNDHFGDAGQVTLPWFGVASEVIRQADGKLLIAGGSEAWDEPLSGHTQSNIPATATILRLNQDGTVDTSFAAGGSLSLATTWGSHNYDIQTISGMTLDSLGRIYATVGVYGVIYGQNSQSISLSSLIRLTPNGNLDSSFAPGGKLDLDQGQIGLFTNPVLYDGGAIFASSVQDNGNSMHASLVIERRDLSANASSTTVDELARWHVPTNCTGFTTEGIRVLRLTVDEAGRLIIAGILQHYWASTNVVDVHLFIARFVATTSGRYELDPQFGDQGTGWAWMPDLWNGSRPAMAGGQAVIAPIPFAPWSISSGMRGGWIAGGATDFGISDTTKWTYADVMHQLPRNIGAADLTATATPQGTVNLRWVDTGDTESGFLIERRSIGSDFAPIAVVREDVVLYEDEDVKPGTQYTYRVRAFDAMGFQATVAADVSAGAPTVAPTASATTAPADTAYVWQETIYIPADGSVASSQLKLLDGVQYQLRASGELFDTDTRQYVDAEYSGLPGMGTTVNSIRDQGWAFLTGTTGSYSVSGYQGHLDYGISVNDDSMDGNKYPYWGSLNLDSNSYVIQMVGNGQTLRLQYHTDLAMRTQAGQPMLRVEVYRAVSTEVSELTVVVDRDTKTADLTWPAAPDAEGYEVWRKTDNGAYAKIHVVGKDKLTYPDNPIDFDIAYTYKVVPISSLVNTTASNEVTVTMVNLSPVCPPVAVSAAVNSDLDYVLPAYDPEGTALSFDWRPGSIVPSWLTLDKLTGALSGTIPAANDVPNPIGTYNLIVVITDHDHTEHGGVVEVPVTLNIVNGAPVITGISPPTYVDSTHTQLSLHADAANQTNIAYSWTLVRGPGAVTFTGGGTTADATATLRAAGTYLFRVTVTRSTDGLSTYKGVQFTVDQVASSLGIRSLDMPSGEPQTGYEGELSFVAYASDQFGWRMAEQPRIHWTYKSSPDNVDGGSPASKDTDPDSMLILTAGGWEGEFPISASAYNGALTAPPILYKVLVNGPVLGSLTLNGNVVSDDSGTFAVGGTFQLHIDAHNYGNDSSTDGLGYLWRVDSKPAGAPDPIFTQNGNYLAATTDVTLRGTGTYKFSVLVVDKNRLGVRSIEVTVNTTPAAYALAITRVPGTTNSFKATLVDQFGNARPGQPADGTFTWSVAADGAGGTMASSTSSQCAYIPPQAYGDTTSETIHVTSGAFSGELSIQVMQPVAPVAKITSIPKSDTVTKMENDTDISILVVDANRDLRSYVLKLVSAAGAEVVLAQGTAEMGSEPLNGVQVATIKPAYLDDGSYSLVLQATDQAGHMTTDTRALEIKSTIKLGGFSFSNADLTVNWPGLPIVVTRSYDSLATGRSGDFGAGWRFDLLDTNLHTTAAKTADSEYGTSTVPSFHDGDVVYFTINGQQHAFYFEPKQLASNGVVDPFTMAWTPHFTPANGENGQLHLASGVEQMDLSRTLDGEYFYIGGAAASVMVGFNPAGSDFGGVYIYQAADGTSYTINAANGRIQKIQTKQGATATVIGDVITGPSRQTIQLIEGTNGLISRIDVKSAGGTLVNSVSYGYDAKNRLTTVTTADGSTTTYLYENATFPNNITGIENALGVKTLSVTYNAQGRLDSLCDMYGKPTSIGGGTVSGNTSQSVTDSTGTSAEVIQDDHGNPIRTITQVRDGAGKLMGYQVSVAQYEYAFTGVIFTARQSRTYFVAGEDGVGLRYSIGPTSPTSSDWQSVTVYDTINPNTGEQLLFPGKVLTQTDASGRTTRYTYDYPLAADGSQLDTVLQSVTDPYGNTTSYVFNTDGTVQSTTANNVTTRYTYTNGTGAYASLPKGLLIDTYRKIGNGSDVLLSHNLYYTSGDSIGMLQSTTDAAGVTTTYTYNAQGQVTQVSRSRTDAQNNSHSVIDSKTVYDADGRTVETVDINGIRSGTIYDAMGRVQTTGRLRANAPDSTSPGGAWYTRDNPEQYFLPNSLSTSTYDGRDNVIQTSYGDGTVTRSAYDSQNRLEWTTDRYDPTSDLLPNGTHTVYDSLGRVARTEQVAKVNIALEVDTDIPGNDTIQRSYRAASGAILSWTQSVYGDQGRVIETVQSDGRTSETLYDNEGRVSITTELHVAGQPANGSRTNYAVDGRVASTEQLTGVVILITTGSSGVPTASLSSSAILTTVSSTQTFYNAQGQVDYTVNQTGQLIPYDSSHRIGQVTTYTYDELGRQKTVTQNAVPTGQSGTPTDEMTTYDYDAVTGRTTCVTDALGHKTWTYYDKPGNVIKTEFNDHSFILYSYDDKGHKTSQTTQLAAGATQAQIDAATTTYQYDADGNLIAVIMPAVADPANGGTMTHTRYVYTYDEYDRQTRQIDANASKLLPSDLSTVTDAQYEAVPHTHFYYDAAGNRIKRELPALNGYTAMELSFYDGLGRLRAKCDFAGDLTVYTYDNLGRQTAETIFAKAQVNAILGVAHWRAVVTSVAGLSSALALADSATPTWGSNGFGVQTTTHYDAYGQVDQVVVKEDADRNGTLDTTREEDTQYDTDGRVIVLASPEGTVHYAYNNLGQKTDMWTDSATAASATNWTQYDYDQLGRLWHVKAMQLNGVDHTASPLDTTYSYDAVGNLDTVTEDNGTTTTSDDLVHHYDYDALSRLDLETVKEGTQTLETYDYFLRADGLRDHVIETDENGAVTRITWTYDALGRLISEIRDEGNDGIRNGGDYTDTYSLDLVGNQVEKIHDAVGTANDETIIKTYNSRDQLISEDSTIDANDATYGYDRNGSQTLKSSLAGDTIYKWDLHNRMVAIDSNDDGTPETVYGYDSSGVRVSERTSDGTRQFLNDPQNPTGYTKSVEEKLDTNNDGTPESVDRSYVVGHQVIAQADSSGVYYLLVDGHGSTRAILNAAAGTLDQKYDYNAYGDLLNTSLTPLTNWLFGGDGVYDPSSGWTYHLSRWRDGDRFVSYDSFEADPTSPVSLHKYLYCSANPVLGWDPGGQFSVDELVTVQGIANIVGRVLQGGFVGSGIGAIAGGVDSVLGGGGFWNGFCDGARAGFVFGATMALMPGWLVGGIGTGLAFIGAKESLDEGKYAQSLFRAGLGVLAATGTLMRPNTVAARMAAQAEIAASDVPGSGAQLAANLLHAIELGKDADHGGAFSTLKSQRGLFLENFYGTLKGALRGGDYETQNGLILDDCYANRSAPNFNLGLFLRSVLAHARKSYDITAVDISQLAAEEKGVVIKFIEGLKAGNAGPVNTNNRIDVIDIDD